MKYNKGEHKKSESNPNPNGIYRPVGKSGPKPRIDYACKLAYALVLFYDGVNDFHNMAYFTNRQDGKQDSWKSG